MTPERKRAIKRERENRKTPNNLCEEYLHWLFTASLASNICYLRGPVTAPCFPLPTCPFFYLFFFFLVHLLTF